MLILPLPAVPGVLQAKSSETLETIIAVIVILLNLVIPLLKRRKRPPAPTVPVPAPQPVPARPAQAPRRPARPQAATRRTARPAPPPRRAPRPEARREGPPAERTRAERRGAEKAAPERRVLERMERRPPQPLRVAMLEDALAPLHRFPHLAQALRSEPMAAALREAAQAPDFPLSVERVVRRVAGLALQASPDLRREMIAGTRVATGIEVNTVADLVRRADVLVAGWLEVLLADAVGLALLGRAFAAARALRLLRLSARNVLLLDLSKGSLQLLEPPLPVVLPALRAGVRLLEGETGPRGLDRALARLERPDEPLVLRLAGIREEPIDVKITAAGLSDLSAAALERLLRYPFSALNGTRLEALVRRRSWAAAGPAPDAGEAAAALGSRLVGDWESLAALIELAAVHGSEAVNAALSAAAAPATLAPATSAPVPAAAAFCGISLCPMPEALPEALVLWELLRGPKAARRYRRT